MAEQRRSLFPGAAAFFLLAAAFLAPAAAAQEPVTGGEDLILRVRALKNLGERVHLEWLYLEDAVDQRPDQKRLVRSGGPLEFTAGALYHGRAGLDDILLSGWIAGAGYLTRAPHVWAIGSFHKSSSGPAVFKIEAEAFNRLRDTGQAALEAEIAPEAGIMDPYPRITAGFSLDLAVEIWIDEDTAARYDRLVEKKETDLSLRDNTLRKAVLRLRGENRLYVLPGLRHTQLGEQDYYPAAFEAVGAFFMRRKLQQQIPGFRLRR